MKRAESNYFPNLWENWPDVSGDWYEDMEKRFNLNSPIWAGFRTIEDTIVMEISIRSEEME